MKESKYKIFDGEIVRSATVLLNSYNRSFRYGDALFETMHSYATTVQFMENHLDRLKESMLLLKMHIPEEINTNYFSERIHKLLDKNKLYQGARIRLSVYRKDGGYYTPETNNISYIIETEALEYTKYELNEQGLIINIYKDIKKPISLLSNIKSSNALLFVLAGIFKKDNLLDDCIIINNNANLCELISSNIFLVKDNNIITPPLEDGCVNGIMRKQVLKLAKTLKYNVYERSIAINNLTVADEIFATNAIQGIQWIGGYKQKRYFNKVSVSLIKELNRIAFKE